MVNKSIDMVKLKQKKYLQILPYKNEINNNLKKI